MAQVNSVVAVSAESQAEFNNILDVVKANRGLIFDDHDPKGGRTLKLAGIGGFVIGDTIRPVALLNGTIFCLNSVYLSDTTGSPRLSRSSIGGNVDARGTSLTDAIEAFNNGEYTRGKLEQVTLF